MFDFFKRKPRDAEPAPRSPDDPVAPEVDGDEPARDAPAPATAPAATAPSSPAADAPAAPAAATPSAPEPAKKPGFFTRLRAKLNSGNSFLTKDITELLPGRKIDAEVLDELETRLLTADVGVDATETILSDLRRRVARKELDDLDALLAALGKSMTGILAPVSKPLVVDRAQKPFVVLVVGVNGSGKTTSIGKLARRYSDQGLKVMLAAGDTFRAAATEQLEEWGKRADVPVVKGKPQGDPSSVIFDAIKRGVDEKFDIVICDTAGRLHSNSGLMDELKKIRRVADKAMAGSPHETWMVLDATTGQNAISQAKTFKADMEITGIVLTKLDGSSKGGVVLGICDELKVPVRFVGVGEQAADLRPFDPAAFVDALYSQAPSDAA